MLTSPEQDEQCVPLAHLVIAWKIGPSILSAWEDHDQSKKQISC